MRAKSQARDSGGRQHPRVEDSGDLRRRLFALKRALNNATVHFLASAERSVLDYVAIGEPGCDSSKSDGCSECSSNSCLDRPLGLVGMWRI